MITRAMLTPSLSRRALVRAGPASRAWAATTVSVPLSARGYSSSHGNGNGKIAVVPFAQSPISARERLLVHGLIASAQLSNVVMAGILRLFGTDAAEAACREIGLGESLVLRDMRPAYYPIWRVDVIAEGPVSSKGEESSGWMAVREGYLPGNAYAPLSYISYAVPPLLDGLDTYDPDRDLHQLKGVDIVEVPFNVSPFAMLEKIRRKLGTVSLGGSRIDQTKWKETMVAAYPVMFPMYIAEFEHTRAEDEVRRYSVIMDAHDEKLADCRVSFPPPDEMRETGRLAKNYYVNPAPFLPSANLILPVTQAFSGPPTPPAAIMAKAYQRWMSPEPTGNSVPASPTYSVTDEPIDWADPRIMPWGGEDHEMNGDYMEKGLEVHRNIEALHAMTLVSDHMPDAEPIIAIGKRVSQESMSNVVRDIADNIEKEKEALEALKPEWLQRYDEGKIASAAAERVEAASEAATEAHASTNSEGSSQH